MMIRIYIILGLIAILIIGYLVLRQELKAIRKDLGFISEFHSNFVAFANEYYDRRFNSNLYQWLTLNSAKSQKMCSRLFSGTLVAPFRAYVSRKHEFITNTIPKMRNGRVDEVEINTTEDILLKTVGVYQGREDNALKTAKNPFKWLQYGIRFIIGFPIQLLKWFGIISNSTFYRFTTSKLTKFVSGFVALITFIGTLITIFAGWDQSVEFVKKILKIE